MKSKALVSMSKFLSLVLRHKPQILGLKMNSEGWVDVDELIREFNVYQKADSKDSKFGLSPLTKPILDEIVAKNNKKRFAYSKDGWSIRASQGHSVDIDLKLNPKIPPECLFHGTAKQFVDPILKSGLKRMKRKHVHLSSTEDTAIKVGSRHGKPQVLRIRAREMQKDGFDFFLSDNGVWMVDEVPAKYIDIKWSYF